MAMLNDHPVEARSTRKPEYLVIFFHGFGSSGAAMAEHVGGLLSPLLPEAKLLFPDAPIKLHEDSHGHTYHSWFEMNDMFDAPDRGIIAGRATAVAVEINAYIDAVIKKEGITADHVILAGFSQGGTMAFYAGLLREEPVAGVFSLSGGALDRLDDPKSRPPVGIAAGELEKQDYSGAPHATLAHAKLDKAGFYTDCAIIPGQKHDISPKSMELLGAFIRTVTSEAFKVRVAQDAEKNAVPQKMGFLQKYKV